MKTTSIITLTGALSIGLLTLLNFNGHDNRAGKYHSNKAIIVNEPLNEDIIYMDLVSAAEVNSLSPASKQKEAGTVTSDVCGDEMSGSLDLCLDDIVYIEAEEPVELGFDTDEYLPAGFDPYATASADLDLDAIEYIEETEDIVLDFDTAAYLPLDFNAYAGMEPDLDEIVFIEAEESVDLGFDTSKYLPEGFDPYAQPELCLDNIPFLEVEEVVDLGFDVDAYLPAGFDPYAVPEFDLSQIPFMETEDETELWLDSNIPVFETAINF